ncbi:MAG: ribosome hibernation-promoting factor, HPF/YfiA family [Thermoanaerobaculia bacterium]
MAVECTGRNVEVTYSLKKLARERTQRLERHLGGPARVRVVLSHEKHRFGAEIIATHRRRRWKAQEETADPNAAVALAFEKIDAQAKRDTEKRRDRKHRAPAPAWRMDVLSGRAFGRPAAGGSDGNRIVRTDRLSIKPMSVEEAAMRIESSRQEFLVFRDSSTERICVLYKRRDGDFGLIVPEC